MMRGIAGDVVLIIGTSHEALQLALNPMCTVATRELDNGVSIPESAAMIEYLEDIVPSPALRPTDPQDLARARLFIRIPDLNFQSAPRILFGMRDPANRNEAACNAAIEHTDNTFRYLDQYVDPAKYAIGGRPSIADCALIPLLNIIGAVMPVFGLTDTISRHPKLGAYSDAAQHEDTHQWVIQEMQNALATVMGESR